MPDLLTFDLEMTKRMRKYYGMCIAAVLLLGFSVTFLPLDLLHDHKAEPTAQTCLDKDAKGACSHKLHLSEKAAYCSICAIHVDKVFVSAEQQKVTSIFPILTGFAESSILNTVSDIIFYSLRGPPSGE